MNMYNGVYTNCFFIEGFKEMGFTDYYCNYHKRVHNNKCPENCPYFMDKEDVYDIVRKYVQEKEKKG